MSLLRRKKESEDEWKKKLTSEQYKILRQKGTEPPFTGKLLHNKEKGIYQCAACGYELFSSDAKFDSGSGWPSFDAPLAKDSVETTSDGSLGMRRIEVHCPNCGGHLGHLFDDGPTTTGKRYCINSGALSLKKS